MNSVRFILRRAIYLIIQLLGVITILFFLVRFLPGNPAQALAGQGASDRTIQSIERRLGLDRPLVVQYAIYLGNLMHGDLGNSIFTGQTVRADLEKRFPATLELVSLSMFLTVIIGVPLGIYVALHSRGI